ncbi:10728_t:CDS:2 [Dentiscutata heterogama]|uniref:10728_t:CDS:1 n=1 Tax=Dentiscutata heterogama TaxID=1316150 RepID=A0ACA9LT88_9GLOM|nr:10728_t:CDS:2 [Dentiscutata heterogama]
MPCYAVKIVEIISKSKVIIDITFENSDKDQHIIQLDDIIGYADKQTKKKRSNYFEICLKNWQKPYIVLCGAKFKAMDKESTNISKNAFKIEKYISVETENVKLSKVKLTRQIDRRLPLIFVINIAEISIIDKEIYLENKDIPEEINFSLENANIKQR